MDESAEKYARQARARARNGLTIFCARAILYRRTELSRSALLSRYKEGTHGEIYFATALTQQGEVFT